MTNYKALLDQLKADIVDYRGGLITSDAYDVVETFPQNPGPPTVYTIRQTNVADNGQDTSQVYDGDIPSFFNDFKTKSIAQAQSDLNSIAILWTNQNSFDY